MPTRLIRRISSPNHGSGIHVRVIAQFPELEEAERGDHVVRRTEEAYHPGRPFDERGVREQQLGAAHACRTPGCPVLSHIMKNDIQVPKNNTART